MAKNRQLFSTKQPCAAQSAEPSAPTRLWTASYPELVYVEGLAGCLYLERPKDFNRYRYVFEQLRGMALSPRDSAELITSFWNLQIVPTETADDG